MREIAVYEYGESFDSDNPGEEADRYWHNIWEQKCARSTVLADDVLSYLTQLSGCSSYTRAIDDRDLSFLDDWKKHLETAV